MKVVSRYVREQKRYTKNDLKSKFSFDEDGVEKFIKNLKAYGVLKSVKNTDDQLEMSDLVDDDVEITDETAESGDCLYVFTYVGVITCGSRVIKVYPKYLLSKKDWFIIFDAKYYNLQLEKGKSLRGNPGVGDVTKQYLYQLAYKDFINTHGIAEVRNCFLMPTEKKDIVKKGCARMAMLEALNLKNIQIRLIPAAELYDNYLTGNHMDITRLEL